MSAFNAPNTNIRSNDESNMDFFSPTELQAHCGDDDVEDDKDDDDLSYHK